MKKWRLLYLLTFLMLFSCSQTTLPDADQLPLTPTQRRTRTPRPTLTATLTLVPTLTSTPQPPLIAHEWFPEQVLILKDNRGWGGKFWLEFPPDFVLYADGLLFIRDRDREKIRLLYKKLDRREICQNLNTLDQIGYLDFDPTTYDPKKSGSVILDAGADRITVNAWKSNRGDFYALGAFLYDELEHGVYGLGDKTFIEPSLRNLYYFLEGYPTTDMEIFQPGRLVIWITKEEKESNEEYPLKFGVWPFESISLADLWTKSGSLDYIHWDHFVVLYGDQAKNVYSFFGEAFYDAGAIVYEENPDGTKTQYLVFARPLLPYEYPQYPIPTPGTPKPNFKLSCYPSDGVLPIPTSLPYDY